MRNIETPQGTFKTTTPNGVNNVRLIWVKKKGAVKIHQNHLVKVRGRAVIAGVGIQPLRSLEVGIKLDSSVFTQVSQTFEAVPPCDHDTLYLRATNDFLNRSSQFQL